MKTVKKDEFAEKIALVGLKIGAFKINTKEPFLDTSSGKFKPVNIDCNKFLFLQRHRNLIIGGLIEVTRNSVNLEHRNLIIAGSKTGIPWASILVDMFESHLLYVEDNCKNYKSKNEGVDEEVDLNNHQAILIDDIISTGEASAGAVAKIRKLNGTCNLCVSIINCGFPSAEKVFQGELPFDTDGFERYVEALKSPCKVKSLLYLPKLLSVAIENDFIKKEEEKTLLEWMENPKYWGDTHEFPSRRKK